jgi:hypothetical protein
VCIGPRADMYLLSLSTLALLKGLLSLSFSPLCVFSMDAYMYMFGGGLGLRFRAQGLGQAVYMYICVQLLAFRACACVHVCVYTHVSLWRDVRMQIRVRLCVCVTECCPLSHPHRTSARRCTRQHTTTTSTQPRSLLTTAPTCTRATR